MIELIEAVHQHASFDPVLSGRSGEHLFSDITHGDKR